MTEIQTPNLYASYVQGMGVGQANFDRNKKLGDQNRLQQLSSGVMAGDPEAIAQATAIDATVAGQYQDSGDRVLKRAGNMADAMIAAVQSGNKARIDGTYQTMLPELTRQGAAHGIVPPPQFDAASMMPHLYEIQARASGITGGKNAAHASQKYIDPQGNVHLVMSDGTEQVLGQAATTYGTLAVPAADGGTDYYNRDNRTGGVAPTFPGQQGAVGAAPQPAATPSAMQTATATDGAPINTYEATAADGSQVRIDPSLPANVRAAILANPGSAATDGATVAAPAQVLPAQGAGQQLHGAPKPAAQGELEKKIALARQMGATPDQIKQMVMGGAAGQGVVVAPGDPSKSGEAYLATIPAEMRPLVKAIADGQQAPPSASSRSPAAQSLLQAVYTYDPQANATNLPARTQTRKDFTSGKSAQNLRALNQAIGHLGLLDSQIGGTASHSIPLIGQYVNAAENTYNRQSGDPGITNYEQTAAALAGELTQVFRGNGGAEADLKRNLDQLSSSQSEAQKKAAMKNITGLLASRIDELGQQYSQGMGKTTDPFTLLNPHAAQIMQRIHGGTQTQPHAGPQPGTIEDGHRFKGGNPADPNSWEAVQ